MVQWEISSFPPLLLNLTQILVEVLYKLASFNTMNFRNFHFRITLPIIYGKGLLLPKLGSQREKTEKDIEMNELLVRGGGVT